MNASTTLPLTTLTEPAAPDAETQFAAVIEFSDDAIIGKTPEAIITSWSSSAEKISVTPRLKSSASRECG